MRIWQLSGGVSLGRILWTFVKEWTDSSSKRTRWCHIVDSNWFATWGGELRFYFLLFWPWLWTNERTDGWLNGCMDRIIRRQSWSASLLDGPGNGILDQEPRQPAKDRTGTTKHLKTGHRGLKDEQGPPLDLPSRVACDQRKRRPIPGTRSSATTDTPYMTFKHLTYMQKHPISCLNRYSPHHWLWYCNHLWQH